MGNKPLIGITKPDNSDTVAYFFIWLSVWLNGGRPIKITPFNYEKDIDLDGLVLGGGKDIFPALFQKEPKPKKDYQYDHERDEMELYWLRKAENNNIPVLGICRGAQLMNVAAGGSLHMDVAKAYEEADYPESFLSYIIYRKRINLKESSLIYKILQNKTAFVNSIHKQSISSVAQTLEVTATEDNGVIQCIEKKGHPFYLGVQFHPEFLIYKKAFRKIFKALVKESINNKK